MFRGYFSRMRERLQRFMWGRYGVDQMGLALLVTAVVLSILGLILTRFWGVIAIIGLCLNLLSYLVLIWYLFRVFSRNLDARRRENRRFLRLFRGVRDRDNRYYRCPNCKQTVRVPRGRGKICIKCPKCGEKFIRKS